jgi:hypothetical protein
MRGCPVHMLSKNFLGNHQCDVDLWTEFPYTLYWENDPLAACVQETGVFSPLLRASLILLQRQEAIPLGYCHGMLWGKMFSARSLIDV